MYFDYLNQAQNQFVGGTRQFAQGDGSNGSNSVRPSDTMQGNRDQVSAGGNEG